MALVLAAAGIVHAQAPGSTAVQSKQIETFLSALQRASRADDRAAIAAMVQYPITISIGGLRVPFADANAFLERYDAIFNQALRDAIARASVSQGAVVGTTDVVISEVNGHFRITSITVPPDAGGGSLPPGVSAPRSAGRQEPRRVAIRVGPQPTRIPGSLAREGTDVYVLFLPKGRLAGIRLERVPVGAAAIRVVQTGTGVPLDARASADARFVQGRPPQDGDYRIEVRATGAVDGHLPYMLSLTLR